MRPCEAVRGRERPEPWLSDCRTLSDAVERMSDAVGGLSDSQMSDAVECLSDACRTNVGAVGQCLTGKGHVQCRTLSDAVGLCRTLSDCRTVGHCRITVGLLSDYCRIPIGSLSEPLLGTTVRPLTFSSLLETHPSCYLQIVQLCVYVVSMPTFDMITHHTRNAD